MSMLHLTDADREGAERLFRERYDNWDWNYGQSPPSNLQRATRFPGGEIDMRLDLQDGRIAAIRLFGDYMGSGDVAEVEQRLTGVPYDREAILTALGDMELGDYFGKIGREEVLSVVCP
jgi:lipoate-protein ligase A